MAKILVKKSAPKGVLIKKRVGQQLPNDQGLFQTPDRGKSFMDFFNTFRGPKRTESKVGVKPTARIAALAGMAGKGLAGLGAVNETMQSMQGGNMTAPLGIGYTYERLDPTGRMISDFADPNLSFKPPKLDRTPPAKFDTGAALKDVTRGPVGKPITLPDGKTYSQDDPVFQSPIKPMNYDNTPHMQNVKAGMSLPQADRVLMQGQESFQPFVPFRPSPVQVPNTAVSNVTAMPVSQMQPPGYPGQVNQVPLPNQASPAPPVKTQQQILQEANQTLMGQPAAPATTAPAPAAPATTAPATTAPAPAAPAPAAPPQGFQYTVGQFADQQAQQGAKPDFFDPNNPNNPQKSFVTALTEKLGADVVYKMTPHQMGTFAAYSLLKLR